MNQEIKLYAVTIDCKEPLELAKFYAKLLHWEIPFSDENFACLSAPNTKQGAYPGINFQKNPDYIPPVWPEKDKFQQQMAHLDFVVSDLKTTVKYALECGATLAKEQFSENWTVLFDPSGHPFCLCEMKSVMESNDFALK